MAKDQPGTKEITWLLEPEEQDYPAAQSYLSLLHAPEKVSLSPLLLVRDEASGKVVIADGYHRLCSVYLFDEDAWIPCKIV
jgi:hypothetical protein